MADLPELSNSTKRKLSLRWETFVQQHQFTGEHFKWCKIQRDPYTRYKPPGWRRNPDDADHPGISHSIELATSGFDDLAGEYWRFWLRTGAGYELFAAWADTLKQPILDEIALLWSSDSKRIGRWYKRACGPAVDEALMALAKNWAERARTNELERLCSGTPEPEINLTCDPFLPGTGPRVALGPREGGELPKDALYRTDAGPAGSECPKPSGGIAGWRQRRGAPRKTSNRHPEVEPYLNDVSKVAHRAVTIREFCLVSGFADDTVFGFWRQGNEKRCKPPHEKKFESTLKLSPDDFLRKLIQATANRP